MPAQTNVCPMCGKNDTIYKVSGVVTSGQASGTFSGPSGGVVNVGGQWGTTGSYTTLSGSTATNLAALLTPPSEPKKRAFGLITTLFVGYFWIMLVGLLGVVLLGYSIAIALNAFEEAFRDPSGLGWNLLFSVVSLGLALLSLSVFAAGIRW